jgi:hypothetical protein
LLRASLERPCCRRAAEQRDELAPFQLTELHRRAPKESVTAYRISEGSVRGPLQCGILNRLTEKWAKVIKFAGIKAD